MEHNTKFDPEINFNKEAPTNYLVNNLKSSNKSEQEYMALLNDLYNQKLYKEMESVCLDFVKNFGHSANSQNFLGLCYFEQSKYGKAEECYKNSLSNQYNEAALNNLGLLYIKQKRLVEALKVFNEAYEKNTKAIQILTNLSLCHELLGEISKSYEFRKKILEIDEFNEEALTRLHTMRNATDDDLLFCLQKLEQLLIKSPDSILLLENLSSILMKLHNHELATRLSFRLLDLEPMNSSRYYNISNMFKAQRKFDDAKRYLRTAIKLEPDEASYWLNLGVIELELGHIYNAIEIYKKATNCGNNKKYEILRNNDATSLSKLDYFTKAWAFNNIANSYIKIGETYSAYNFYNKALQMCDDGQLIEEKPVISQNLLCNLGYLFDNAKKIYEIHRKFRKDYDEKIELCFSENQKLKTNGKIRIGYVSPDFKKHSVAFFFDKLLENHDKNNFEIYLYSNLETKKDNITHRFENLCDHWRDVRNNTDNDLIQKIKDDNINILVDLAGNFSGGRTNVFGLKPAPIQVSYLGYVTTTGLKSMDYRFTTFEADPNLEEDQFYTEKLVRLPNTFLCYSGIDVYTNNNPPYINNNYLTFGSFNNISKITDKTIKSWSKILVEIPKSILLIKSSTPADQRVHDEMILKFKRYNVDGNRIKHMSKTRFMKDHLKIYNSVDIALDTFPFNGATTTLEALWMGVPVMTIRGNVHHARVSTSVLKALSMDYCIAKNEKEFVEKTVKMSKDIKKLKILRNTLRENIKNSSLNNGKLFAQNVEGEYLKMFEKLK